MTARRRHTVEPRCYSREQAATYLSISVTFFDKHVANGTLPPPKGLGERLFWDKLDLDHFLDNLPYRGPGRPDQAAPNSAISDWDRKLGLDQTAA